MDLERELKQLPDLSGVYLFYDAKDVVIYVGKARSLSKRVPSHFRGPPLSPVSSPIGQETTEIEYIVTANESEALVLEDNLIKQYKPRYNIRLKDDKSFPYVRFTLGEKFPRVEKTRTIINDGSRYIGPFSNVKALDGLLKSINRIVPIATCGREIQPGKRNRACLKYDINRCPAPCMEKISEDDYAELVNHFTLMLTGRHDELEVQLKKLMVKSSNAQEYEKAARFRDRLRAVQRGRQAQRATMWNQLPGHRDVIGLARSGPNALIQLLVVRSGRIVGQQPFPLNAPSAESDERILEAFLKQYYLRATEIPDEVVISIPIQDKVFLQKWLTQRHSEGHAVRIFHPRRGPRRSLAQMAVENAEFHLQQLLERIASDKERIERAYSELIEFLRLPHKPHYIEGFDISTLQGVQSVGVSVAFLEGLPSKKQYRRYKIHEVVGQDDFSMMHEVVSRRYSRLVREQKPLPDLILIDGGRGQLNMARSALQEVGANTIPVVGLAKGDSLDQDVIYVNWQKSPIRLPKDGEGYRLLTRVRDEAHRFALRYHRSLRQKQGLKLTLTEIPGVGIRRATKLLTQFGSLKKISKASIEEIAAVPNISRKLARKIVDFLSKNSK